MSLSTKKTNTFLSKLQESTEELVKYGFEMDSRSGIRNASILDRHLCNLSGEHRFDTKDHPLVELSHVYAPLVGAIIRGLYRMDESCCACPDLSELPLADQIPHVHRMATHFMTISRKRFVFAFNICIDDECSRQRGESTHLRHRLTGPHSAELCAALRRFIYSLSERGKAAPSMREEIAMAFFQIIIQLLHSEEKAYDIFCV